MRLRESSSVTCYPFLETFDFLKKKYSHCLRNIFLHFMASKAHNFVFLLIYLIEIIILRI